MPNIPANPPLPEETVPETTSTSGSSTQPPLPDEPAPVPTQSKALPRPSAVLVEEAEDEDAPAATIEGSMSKGKAKQTAEPASANDDEQEEEWDPSAAGSRSLEDRKPAEEKPTAGQKEERQQDPGKEANGATDTGGWQAIWAPAQNGTECVSSWNEIGSDLLACLQPIIAYYFWNANTGAVQWENPLAATAEQSSSDIQPPLPEEALVPAAATWGDSYASSSTRGVTDTSASSLPPIDPALAHLLPASQRLGTTNSSDAHLYQTAQFNARTGRFTANDYQYTVDHLAEANRAKRQEMAYFDVAEWEKEREEEMARKRAAEEAGDGDRPKKLTKKDMKKPYPIRSIHLKTTKSRHCIENMAMHLRPGTETIRFRRPTAGPNAVKANTGGDGQTDKFGGKFAPDVKAWKRRHMGLLQDLVGRQANGPFTPGFSFAVRLLLLIRVGAAMYSNIQDCDEVFNFFEPLHYFVHNSGFQTWELSPEYSVRSWAYILLHWPFAQIAPTAMSLPKRASFFCLRIGLGVICSVCEAKFYRSVAENLNERAGRYTLAILMFSAGMWNAGVAFLPSSFAMYLTMLGYAYYLKPSTVDRVGDRRVMMATISFAIGAILGWPFAALLGLPFVFEELFIKSGDEVVGEEAVFDWRVDRIGRLIKSVVFAAAIAIPVFAFDSWAYGKPTFPTLNILLYNLFSGKGPELYGTEPPTFYLANLFLNFNFTLPLALISMPALVFTYFFDFRRLGVSQTKPKPGQSSPYTLVALRLSGFYLWLIVMSLQPHKEERFMYPAYPLMILNAAVSVFLIRGWAETAYIKATTSSYRASQSRLFSYLTLGLVLPIMILSVSRIYALGHFYRSPYDVIYHFQYTEVPKLLRAAGHEPIPPPEEYRDKREEQGYSDEWDYTVLGKFEPKIRLCYGKEWYRFLGSYLVPEGIEVDWIRSEFNGAMPRRWEPSHSRAGSWWLRQETRITRAGKFNDDNIESTLTGTYVDPSECTYLIDSSMPSQPPTTAEPAYTSSDEWERLYCESFLDNAASKWWARIFYLPGKFAEEGRTWGEYCLLKRK
ncbi:hypothetical protein QFC19_001593 [Naganishia cerealis]|uniref:Uncharacterized protein n=1 Tax=Naganishia cerealis TaxID=610337 RepID=A0ACC2WFN2_9TREE|nr:hypothetical protein QFC19_001593 [Naganishia cerealis]